MSIEPTPQPAPAASTDGIELEAMGSIGHAWRWLKSPEEAFRRWKESQRVRGVEFEGHSIEQYVSMWGRFCGWMAANGLRLDRIGAADIERFLLSLRGGRLGERPCAPSTRRRYLFLLHRTFEHLAQLEIVPENPAARLPELARHQAQERPARMLLREDQEQTYIDWCLAQPVSRWEQLRNQALRLIFLGSGITVAEARALTVADVVIEDESPATGFAALSIAAHGSTPARLAPVSAFAVAPLANWMRVRWMVRADGDVLFNAARPAPAICAIIDDPSWGRWRPGPKALSAEEMYDIVAQAMRECGWDRRRAGPQTLRNAFMARQIREGMPLDRIRDWVGLRTTESLQALRRQVPRRLDGLVPH